MNSPIVSILPSTTDRWRTKRDGKRRYVGQILRFENGRRRVIAEVYGDSLEEMRGRKQAVYEALRGEQGELRS